MKTVSLAWLPGMFFVGGACGVLAASFFLVRTNGALYPQYGMGVTTTRTIVTEDRTTSVVKRASPAVVSITITKEVARRRGFTDLDLFEEPFFQFEGPRFRTRTPEPTRERLEVGNGTGFFVSSDGLLVTNRHVASEKDAEYTVELQSGKTYPAKVLAIDPVLDLAVLKVEGSDFPSLSLGDSDAIQVGEPAIAIGYALGEFRNTVTKGVISGVNRRVVAGGASGVEVLEEAIQTDAAINPGNSGGPLLNAAGEVIGMNTAVSQNGQSLGFALPSNVLKRSIESVKQHGRVVRPWLGVRYVPVDEETAKEAGLEMVAGARVIADERGTAGSAVVKDSPADKAGIKEGDIILSVEGVSVDRDRSLASLLSRHLPGAEVRLRIWRDKKEMEVKVTLDERKET